MLVTLGLSKKIPELFHSVLRFFCVFHIQFVGFSRQYWIFQKWIKPTFENKTCLAYQGTNLRSGPTLLHFLQQFVPIRIKLLGLEVY